MGAVNRRRSVLAAAVAVVLASLGASPAPAFVIIGPTQVPDAFQTQDINVPNPTLTFNQGAPVGVRLRSPIEGVITSWRTYSGSMSVGTGVQLRVLADEGGGSYRVLRSGPIETPPGTSNGKATEQTFSARIAIPVGGMVGVQRTRPSNGANVLTRVHDQADPSPWLEGWFLGGSSNPPADGEAGTPETVDGTPGSSDPFFPISAIVEPDADHDSFGDETQDRCPSAAGDNSGCPGAAVEVPAAPAQGATLLGPNLDVDPATVVTTNRPSPSLVMNTVPAAGVQLRARFRGVVTRWSFYTGEVTAGSSAQLRVLRRVGENDYQAITSGPVEALSPGTGTATQRTFAASVPVGPGDELGVGLQRDAAGTLQLTTVKTEISPPPWAWGQFTGTTGNSRIPNDGEIAYPEFQASGPLVSTFLPISAVVERDSDGDLFGDHTQDRCLNSAGPLDGCPAPTPPPPATPQPVVNTIVPASANAIINVNRVKFTAGRKKLIVGVSCPAQRAKTCAGRLTAKTASKIKTRSGKKKLLSLGSTSFKIVQGTAKTLGLKVPATTRTVLKPLKRVKLTLALGATRTISKTVK